MARPGGSRDRGTARDRSGVPPRPGGDLQSGNGLHVQESAFFGRPGDDGGGILQGLVQGRKSAQDGL
jgi:hypothetical protein